MLLATGLSASGKWSGHDANTFEMDFGGRGGAAVLAGVSSSHAQQTIRVGWTIPAEESKYWMMRRPAEFPNLGKTYNVEWTQFQVPRR